MKEHPHPAINGQSQEQGDQHWAEDQEWAGEHCEEDDGLGYYPDGVKRTLTDEQIEIFRHSELEALGRAKDKAGKLRNESVELLKLAYSNADVDRDDPDDGEILANTGELVDIVPTKQRSGSEDGELEDDDSSSPPMTEAEAKRLKRKRARQRKQAKNKKFQTEPKVDLRKRTWDVVEDGMDSLDYDELEGAQVPGFGLASKRRQISYDD